MKRCIALVLLLGLLLGLTGCGKQAEAEKKIPKLPMVGICLPADDPYWTETAQTLSQALEAQGYQTELRWANNDIPTQVRQVGDLIASMADCLVIAPVDSMALIEVEEEAARVGIPVVAYDRLLMDTDAVTAHVTFDYLQMGMDMGSYIAETMQLKTAEAEGRSYTIEFFMGPAADNNALLLSKGILWELNAYLASGVLVCRTGRMNFEDTYILRWDEEIARQKCGEYLANYYTPEDPLDICCAASDALAMGCINALVDGGYTAENWPLITGQGATAAGLAELEKGRLAVTFQKDAQALAQAGAEAALAVMQGIAPPSNAIQVGDNHVLQVPSWVCDYVQLEAPKPETAPEDAPEPPAAPETEAAN